VKVLVVEVLRLLCQGSKASAAGQASGGRSELGQRFSSPIPRFVGWRGVPMAGCRNLTTAKGRKPGLRLVKFQRRPPRQTYYDETTEQ